MNRPQLDEDTDMLEHIYKLEKYCDELEAKLASYIDAESGFKQTINALEERVNVLEKAFDEACYKLGNESIYCPYTDKKYAISICWKCETKCKDVWKEKFMKEVEDEKD